MTHRAILSGPALVEPIEGGLFIVEPLQFLETRVGCQVIGGKRQRAIRCEFPAAAEAQRK